MVLDADTFEAGLTVAEGTEITLDLNGHRLRGVGPFAGSEGTQANCLWLAKGSKVTIKNGTIDTIAPGVTILIQNYSDLTLDNVKLAGYRTTDYVLSNNCGNTVIKGNTQIVAKSGKVAFDVHYGLLPEYDDGVSVTIADPSVKITGAVEFTKADRVVDNAEFLSKAHLYVPTGYRGFTAPDGYEFGPANDSQDELVPASTETE